jgi:hypothetical protein
MGGHVTHNHIIHRISQRRPDVRLHQQRLQPAVSPDLVHERPDVPLRRAPRLRGHDPLLQRRDVLLQPPALVAVFHDPLDASPHVVLGDDAAAEPEPEPDAPEAGDVGAVDELVAGDRAAQQWHPVLDGLHGGVPATVREVAPDGGVAQHVLLRRPVHHLAEAAALGGEPGGEARPPRGVPLERPQERAACSPSASSRTLSGPMGPTQLPNDTYTTDPARCASSHAMQLASARHMLALLPPQGFVRSGSSAGRIGRTRGPFCCRAAGFCWPASSPAKELTSNHRKLRARCRVCSQKANRVAWVALSPTIHGSSLARSSTCAGRTSRLRINLSSSLPCWSDEIGIPLGQKLAEDHHRHTGKQTLRGRKPYAHTQ